MGRTSRAGRSRGRGRGRGRGRALTQGGLGAGRPSATDLTQCGIDDMHVQDQPLERPLHIKHARTIAPSAWHSLETILWSSQHQHSDADADQNEAESSDVAVTIPACSAPPSPALTQILWSSHHLDSDADADQNEAESSDVAVTIPACSAPPSPALTQILWSSQHQHSDADADQTETESSDVAVTIPVCSAPPSPAFFVECIVGSAASTPTPHRGTKRPEPGNSRSSHRSPACSLPKVKRCLISTSSAASSSRHLHDNEISEMLFYGSEEDSDNSEEEELGTTIFKSRREYEDDVEDEDETPKDLQYQWPPRPRVPVPVVVMEPESEPQPQPESEPQPQPESEPQPQPESEPQPQPESEPQPQPESEPQPQPESEPQPQPESEPQPQPESEPQPQPESEPQPQPESEPQPQPESEPQPQPESEPQPQPESEPQPQSQSEPQPQPESESLHINKFDFEWRAFPTSQIPAELRREPFSHINCGPTAPFNTPYEAFTAIWDRPIMEHIARETNLYAEQVGASMLQDGSMRPCSRITKWVDTTVEELYVYFAIILATGIVSKSRLEDYWNKTVDIFSTPGFTVVMRYDRFHLLSRCLHFQNNVNVNIATMTRPEAKVHKIRPILDHLNDKFSQLYNLSQNIALDESLTMWKGWLDINQFIHNKAASVGIKSYEVCESTSGYLWRFEIHAGHVTDQHEESPVSGTVPALVLRLLNGLEHKGHTIWMDNFYNSPALARELKCRGFDCVGTLRTNRKFVPVELTQLKKNEMAVGQVYGCTSGDVDLVVWKDKNRVALISTYHGLQTVNCGPTPKPSIVPDYNVRMGGVDKKDQMLSMYPIERRRNKVWYKKLFRRLLNTSVLNAYVLLTQDQNVVAHRAFRKTLVKQLIERHTPNTDTDTHTAETPEIVGHFPAQYNFMTADKRERHRKVCQICKKRTSSYCKKCNITLCAFTCFEPHVKAHIQ